MLHSWDFPRVRYWLKSQSQLLWQDNSETKNNHWTLKTCRINSLPILFCTLTCSKYVSLKFSGTWLLLTLTKSLFSVSFDALNLDVWHWTWARRGVGGLAGGMVIVSEHLSHMMLDFTTGNINILVLSYWGHYGSILTCLAEGSEFGSTQSPNPG